MSKLHCRASAVVGQAGCDPDHARAYDSWVILYRE